MIHKRQRVDADNLKTDKYLSVFKFIRILVDWALSDPSRGFVKVNLFSSNELFSC